MRARILAVVLSVALLPLSSFAKLGDAHTSFTVNANIIRPISIEAYDVNYGDRLAPAPGQNALIYHQKGLLKVSSEKYKWVRLSLNTVREESNNDKNVIFYAYFKGFFNNPIKEGNVFMLQDTQNVSYYTAMKVKPGAVPVKSYWTLLIETFQN